MTPHLMRAAQRVDLQADRGEGCYLFDVDGKRYLDFISGVAVNAVGHCHPRLVEALAAQSRKLWHASNMVRLPEQERLADRLCEASFADAVFFTNSGAEAIEFALKLVRRFFNKDGQPGRWRSIAFEGAFHGRTLAAIAAGGQAKLTRGFEPVVPGFDHVPFGDLEAVRAVIGPETAAIILEPVQGDGGIRVFPVEFMRALRHLCDEHGLLLVLDEVQTGIGRTGKFFAHEWAGIAPDILTSAKGLGAGFPLGAVLTTRKIADLVTPGSHGTTLGGAPLATAVGHVVLDIVLADGFLSEVVATAEALRAGLDDLARRYPKIIAEVRGLGLLIGLRCAVDNTALLGALRSRGLLAASASDNVVRLLPPLNITAAHVMEALVAIEGACEDLSAASDRPAA